MNQYEWSAETYLHQRRIPFSRVRDAIQVEGRNGPLKNFDYIVESPDGGLLLEIKGRRFPTAGGGRWENWVTESDLDALEQWQALFRYTGLLVFVYRHLDPEVRPGRSWTPFVQDQLRFGIVACSVSEYRKACRRRSEKWRTVTVPRKEFVGIVRPFSEWLPGSSSPNLFSALPSPTTT